MSIRPLAASAFFARPLVDTQYHSFLSSVVMNREPKSLRATPQLPSSDRNHKALDFWGGFS